MTDENQIDNQDDDSFDEFAEAIDNGTPISEAGLGGDADPEPQEHEDSEELPEAAELKGQPRDELGRFSSKDADGAGDTEEPTAGLNPDEVDWKAETEKWQHRYNSDLGRQNAFQRKIAEQQKMIEQLQKTSQSRKPEGSGVSDEEWETIKNDFPEIAEAMERRFSSMELDYQHKVQGLEQQLQPMQEKAEQQYVQSQLSILTQQHPDWQTVRQSNDFNEWINQQPLQVQEMLSSNEAADAGWLLDQFKITRQATSAQAHKDELQQQRQNKLRQAQTVSRRGVIPTDDLDSDDAMFDHFADKIDRNRRRA